MNIGNVLQLQGDYEHALLRYQKALAIQEVALGPAFSCDRDSRRAARRRPAGPETHNFIILWNEWENDSSSVYPNGGCEKTSR